MFSLSKKTDYALIALSHLAQHRGSLASARVIAETYELPGALLMNIMKTLHNAKIVRSVRGTKGGYQISADLEHVSLFELLEIVDGKVKQPDCMAHHAAGDGEACGADACRIQKKCPTRTAVVSLHLRLAEYLKFIKLADLVTPGRVIQDPVVPMRSHGVPVSPHASLATTPA